MSTACTLEPPHPLPFPTPLSGLFSGKMWKTHDSSVLIRDKQQHLKKQGLVEKHVIKHRLEREGMVEMEEGGEKERE